jgi:hypothetical protein
MEGDTNSRASCVAVGQGGPMDGVVLGDDMTATFEVTMTDGTRWRYVRSAPSSRADARAALTRRL